MFRQRTIKQQTVKPLFTTSVASTSSTYSGDRCSDFSFKATADLDYRRLTAVVMTKLRDRSTASVAVDVIALIGCKQDELVKFN